MSDRNLLTETLEILARFHRSGASVRWVGVLSTWENGKPTPIGTWDDFVKWADFTYNAGYGGVEVNMNLVIVGDDWWLERGEYDGSEWWEFKTIPLKPRDTTPLRADDLKERA